MILGNLDDLHPFSTEHFTIFPCILSLLLVQEKVQRLVPVGHCSAGQLCFAACRLSAAAQLFCSSAVAEESPGLLPSPEGPAL